MKPPIPAKNNLPMCSDS